MTTLPTLTFQTLREDDDAENPEPVATGRTLQKKLQMHGVAHGRQAGSKRKPEGVGFNGTTLWCIVLLFVACAIALTLFLTLG